MYCVIRGTDGSALEENDFNVFGPFATKPEAEQWIVDFQAATGEDMAPDDEYWVHELLSPFDQLRQEQQAQAAAEKELDDDTKDKPPPEQG